MKKMKVNKREAAALELLRMRYVDLQGVEAAAAFGEGRV